MTNDPQATCRSIQEAISRPGALMTLPEIQDPSPFGIACAAILHALLDRSTPVALFPPDEAKAEWLRERCDVPIPPAREADYCISEMAAWNWNIGDLCIGSDEAPETGATLILEMPSLGDGPSLYLQGLGIRDRRRLSGRLNSDFLSFWKINNRLYPCGIDLIMRSKASFLCLPRTTRIETF